MALTEAVIQVAHALDHQQRALSWMYSARSTVMGNTALYLEFDAWHETMQDLCRDLQTLLGELDGRQTSFISNVPHAQNPTEGHS